MTYQNQPSTRYGEQPAAPDPGEVGRQSWSQQEWVKNLFRDNPMLVSLAERQYNGCFGFNFVMVIKLPGGCRHRYIEWSNFN